MQYVVPPGESKMTDIAGFDFEQPFHYENGSCLTSDVSRIGKVLAHFEICHQVVDLSGSVLECGVLKGTSLMR